MSAKEYTRALKNLAQQAGFDFCRISQSGYLDSEVRRLENWLSQGLQGGMGYMSRNIDLRLDPSKLLPGAQSVVVLAINYHTSVQPTFPRVSMYASGRDYHKVIKKKMKGIVREMQTIAGNFVARGFVDSAPVLERAWAVRSGMGFIGKSGNLIIPKAGSYFFLATIICDLELEYDPSFDTEHCGDCTLCIDACPTSAILPDKVVDGGRCISYYTIETKEEHWKEDSPDLDQWLFGCDACQTVCPWNRFSRNTNISDFQRKDALQTWNYEDWEDLSKEDFENQFAGSPLRRKGYEGIKSTLKYLHQTRQTEDDE